MIKQEIKDFQSGNVCASGSGMSFGYSLDDFHWIDDSGRSNGYSKGNLIENPAYIIESIIRDEILVERDLIEDGISYTDDYVDFDSGNGDPLYTTDDYYNGAYLHDVKNDWSQKVLDYEGTNKRFYVNNVVPGSYSPEGFYLTNINANIDTDSFDAVGNTADGSRDGWLFARSFNTKQSSQSILNELCFESHCMLLKSHQNWKLIAIDYGTAVGTFNNPLIQDGRPMIACSLSSLDNVYTEFELLYNYDYQKSDYVKKAMVNKDNSSSSTYLGSSYKTLCRNAERYYKRRNIFTHKSNWIYDDTTAYYLLQKWAYWFTKQRLEVKYTGDIKNHIQYEIGDIVNILYTDMIPASMSAAQFMITEKIIKPIFQQPQVEFKLIEVTN